jgi:hypothetical protein
MKFTMRDVEAQKEDDEHCIDFDLIFKTNFQGKAENWEHLREHFNRLRRVVPYYLVKNHHAVISVATEKILEEMEEKRGKKNKRGVGKDEEDHCTRDEEKGRGVGEEQTIEGENDDGDDEDDDWEWDDDYFGAPPDSY